MSSLYLLHTQACRRCPVWGESRRKTTLSLSFPYKPCFNQSKLNEQKRGKSDVETLFLASNQNWLSEIKVMILSLFIQATNRHLTAKKSRRFRQKTSGYENKLRPLYWVNLNQSSKEANMYHLCFVGKWVFCIIGYCLIPLLSDKTPPAEKPEISLFFF